MPEEKVRVLIVAESSEGKTQIATRMKDEGCEVHMTDGLTAGRRAARREQFDTVIFLGGDENPGETEIIEAAHARNSQVEILRVKPEEAPKTNVALRAVRAQLRAGHEIPHAASRFQDLFDAVFDGVLMVDVATESITDANAAAADSLGYTREEIRGMSVWKLIPEDRRDSARRMFDRILNVGWTAAEGVVLRPKDRELLHCQCNARLLGKPSGKLVRIVFRDVSEKRRLIQYLMEAAKSIPFRDVISGIVHEINNPIAAIVGYAQLSLTTTSRKKLDGYLQTIHQQGARCQAIVQKLSSFARRPPSHRKVTNLNGIIEDVVSLFASELRVGNIDLNLNVCPSPIPVEADRAEIEQLFVTLISNARDAMASSATRRLSISTECSEEQAVVTVSHSGNDDGADLRDKLSGPFSSPGAPMASSGLSASQSIVRDNKGEIEALPSPGNGVTLRIRFPLAE